MKRYLLALSAVAALLAGCGSSRPSPPAIAVVNDRPITQAEYEQYVAYAGEYFAAAGQGRCPGQGPACAGLKVQVLRRMLEQRVIQQYAQDHGIALSPSEQKQVQAQLQIFASTGSPARKLLTHHLVSRDFIRSVLADQRLVQKVESAVLPRSLIRGLSYRLRIVTVPYLPLGAKAAYTAALDLATSGGAAPAGATDRTEWIAAFRLGEQAQSLLGHAQIGQYVGPVGRPDGYRDFQLLGERLGTYGRPARQRLETAYFRHWLASRLRAAHPTCYQGAQPAACPGQNA